MYKNIHNSIELPETATNINCRLSSGTFFALLASSESSKFRAIQVQLVTKEVFLFTLARAHSRARGEECPCATGSEPPTSTGAEKRDLNPEEQHGQIWNRIWNARESETG